MAFDTKKYVIHLKKHAGKHSRANCAKFVRRALEAGGADTKSHPTAARLYGPVLQRNGFHAVTVDNPDNFHFQQGDTVVFEPTKNGNPAGHIAAYDGKNWVSDFVQTAFWPGPAYAKEKPSYVVYRR